MKRACVLHDQANLWLVPLLCILAVSGLLDLVDPLKVTVAFTWYIVADFTWVAVQPDAVPSLPSLILFHHAVAFVLLCFPLRYPQLGLFTCWDGLVELNTFFLIARRQLRWGRSLFSFLYWITFWSLRVVMYPYLLYKFYLEMQPYSWWELVTVCGCQAILVAFNAVFFYLSIASWLRGTSSSRNRYIRLRGAALLSSAFNTSFGCPKLKDNKTAKRPKCALSLHATSA